MLLLLFQRWAGLQDPLALGCATVSPLGFSYTLFDAFFSPDVDFLQYLAVAVELELLSGSSSLFPSFLFIATCHLGVTLKRRDGVRAGGLLQRHGKSWCLAPAEMNVSSSTQPAAPVGTTGYREAVGRQVWWSLPC